MTHHIQKSIITFAWKEYLSFYLALLLACVAVILFTEFEIRPNLYHTTALSSTYFQESIYYTLQYVSSSQIFTWYRAII